MNYEAKDELSTISIQTILEEGEELKQDDRIDPYGWIWKIVEMCDGQHINIQDEDSNYLIPTHPFATYRVFDMNSYIAIISKYPDEDAKICAIFPAN